MDTIAFLREPWDVTVVPETEQVRVSACYPQALAALRAAATGHDLSEVLASEDPDYSHVVYFYSTDPDLVSWIEQYLAYLATLTEPPPPPAPVEPEPAPVAVTPAAAATQAAPRRQAVTVAPPAPRWPVPRRLVAVAVLACLLMGGAYWVELSKGRVATAARPRRPAPVATDTTARAARAVTTETAVAAAPAPPPEPAAPVSGGKLILWVVDVGQGDGLVLRMPNGKFAVVDVAREGGEAVMALLRAKGCSRITDMVLTHPHADHIGDMANVLKKFRVGRFLESGAGHATSSYRYLLAALKRKRTDVDTARSGMRLNWDPQVQVTVLHADANPEKDNLNNSSVVLRVQYGRTSMLLMGDAEAEVEQDLLANSRRQLNADVLKVGHHGSHSSSTAAFIDAVSPKYALISAGANNRFHHPHPTTVSTLTEHNARVYRTDRHGTITATSDGQRVTMSTEQGGR